MTRPRTLAVVASLTLLASVPAYADSVTFWNNIIVNAVLVGRSAGPPSLLDIALAHAAIHDAVQVIDGKYQPYHYSAPPNAAASSDIAVAAAARRILVLLYPAQELAFNDAYDAYVANTGPDDPAATAIGDAAARSLHTHHYRKTTSVAPNFGNDRIGQWRSPPTPFGFLFLATSKPFTLNRVDQFRPQPPPLLSSTHYARD